MKELMITGEDLKAYMAPGPDMGKLLSWLLNSVIEGVLKNDKDVLLRAARDWLKK